jgi:hypothetical protein
MNNFIDVTLEASVINYSSGPILPVLFKDRKISKISFVTLLVFLMLDLAYGTATPLTLTPDTTT